ncbi:MAG: hypothetical protein Q4G52_03085 [Clostridia bacterium]|nr:hypothetical protein [Clostridia bacterium]
MMKHRMLIIPMLLLLVSCTFLASASGTSSATISSDEDGAWGEYFTLEDNRGWSTADTYVKNESSSTNVLWAAGQSKSGNEFCKASAKAGENGNAHAKDIKGGEYRVVLDPSGPMMKGCNGSGSHSSIEGR